MAAASFTAEVVEALANPAASASEHSQRELSAGIATVPSQAQRIAAPRDFMIPKQVMALSISWPARLVLSEVLRSCLS